MYSTTNHNAKTNKNPIGVPPTTPKAHQKAKGKKDLKQTITDRIISLMEAGPESWQKTWKDAAAAGMPTNAITNQPYKGINVLVLWSHRIEQGFQSNKWMTYRQAKSVGAQVRKGERSITCIYFQMVEKKKNKEGAEDKKEFFPLMRAFNLFNLDQIDNVPDELKDEIIGQPKPDFDFNAKAEEFLQATGAKITHRGNRAFYRPSTDEIILPQPEAFITPENYYATACHELTHWTGHQRRLARDFEGRFGDESYAFEELVAELGASFLCGHFGFIDATVENHASYLSSWIKVLKNDKNAIFIAARHASNAYDYLLSTAGITQKDNAA